MAFGRGISFGRSWDLQMGRWERDVERAGDIFVCKITSGGISVLEK